MSTHNPAALRALSMRRKTADAKSREVLEAWQVFIAELKQTRLALNLTHRDVAEGIGVTLAQVSGWERTVSCPHPHDLIAWATFLGVALTTKSIE